MATVRADRQERVACSQALGNRHRGELPAINGVVQNHIVPAIGSTHDDSRDSRAIQAAFEGLNPGVRAAACCHEPAALGIPEPEASVGAQRDQPAAIGHEGCRFQQATVPLENGLVPPGRPIDDANGAVMCVLSPLATIRTDGQGLGRVIRCIPEVFGIPITSSPHRHPFLSACIPRGIAMVRADTEKHVARRHVRHGSRVHDESLHSGTLDLLRLRGINDRRREGAAVGTVCNPDHRPLQTLLRIEHNEGIVEPRGQAAHFER